MVTPKSTFHISTLKFILTTHFRKDSFIYGCHNKNKPLTCREFPYIFDQTSKYFNYSHCNFCVQKCKEGSARVSIWKMLKNPNIFTLETSFFGASKKKSNGKPYQYTINDYKEIGKDFCRALLVHFCSV